MEVALVNALHAAGYRGLQAPVFIQCFEVAPLSRLRALTDLPLVQLVDAQGAPWDFVQSGDPRQYQDLLTDEGLSFIASYANALGANKNLLIPRNGEQELTAPTDLVARAHKAGLRVHPWTFRAENFFLPPSLRRSTNSAAQEPTVKGNGVEEIKRFLGLGIDGFFTDNTDVGIEARAQYKMPQNKGH
jgi:glycerophosphoryl diester phosphodiesterase